MPRYYKWQKDKIEGIKIGKNSHIQCDTLCFKKSIELFSNCIVSNVALISEPEQLFSADISNFTIIRLIMVGY